MKKIILLLILGAIAYGAYVLFRNPGELNSITPRIIDYFDFPVKENPSKYVRTLKAAVISLPSHPDKKENIDKIKSIIENTLADDIDVKLIIFGETSLGLYNGGDKYQKNIAETIPGPFTKILADYAMRNNIHIAAGMAEWKEGKLYNSLVVVDPFGKIAAVHRKRIFNSIDEANGFTKADLNHQVVTVDGFRFGLALSGEADDKWLFDQYQKENLDALICPVSSEIPWYSRWLDYWPYAKKYKAWILSPNRVGTEGGVDFDGTVFVASPGGYIDFRENPANNKLVYLIGK